MMKGFRVLFILFRILFGIIASCNGWSDSCISRYKEGSAPAVLQSQECAFEYLHPRSRNYSSKCQVATLQGRRAYQEDRVLCDLDMQISLLGNYGQENREIGLAAVFDGHGGKEASELAIQLLPSYLHIHISFLTQKDMDFFEEERGVAFPLETEVNSLATHFRRQMNEPNTMKVIEEAILLTIRDIDSTFSEMALMKHLLSGTTATVALIVDGQLLVANVGDSKAFLCSDKIQPCDKLDGTNFTSLQVTELTEDHHPDRDDERARIRAAGGFVTLSGVPRVNGVLAVSRSIGDVYLKRYGVVAEPEVMGWRDLNASDVFLVVASDGIFESLSPQDICSLAQDARVQNEDEKCQRSSRCSISSLAECIVDIAFEKGSTDNLSAVIVPLRKMKA